VRARDVPRLRRRTIEKPLSRPLAAPTIVPMARIPNLHKLARQSGRYDAEAFSFVSQGLCHAARKLGKRTKSGSDRHLCARELLEGTLDLAADRYGLLAELVLRSWGLRAPEDIGEITFLLIEHGVFSKQPQDRLEDFTAGPAFGPALTERVHRRVMAEESPAT
jgi:uncharacterized repeat protein (TIGR04138 family)